MRHLPCPHPAADARHAPRGMGLAVACGTALIGLAAVTLTACSTVPANEALSELPAGNVPTTSITTAGYRLFGLEPAGTSSKLLVTVALSGGGKRSAAFAYGALQGLRDFTISVDRRQRRLLDEIDVIASVSGGSFTAAYYGLYRDKIFTDFDRDFLRRDIESYIWGIYLLPWKWEWLTNPVYGTNDAMAEVYDRLMFHGATYKDLIAKGEPLISINATDINYSAVFPFTQNQFDLICSDLTTFPISRAVAASNGFPIVFTPITLSNFADKCSGRRPVWLDEISRHPELSRERIRADVAARYLDRNRTQYVHLMDGGIADNLAMRGMADHFMTFRYSKDALRITAAKGLRHLLMISIDGQSSADSAWPTRRTVSGFGQILNAVSGTQIDRYNLETLLVAREQMGLLAEALRKARCEIAPTVDGHPCRDVRVYLMHLSLANITDPAIRERLSRIPTGLTIPDEDVDLLVKQGAALMLSSDTLHRFRQSLAADSAGRVGRQRGRND